MKIVIGLLVFFLLCIPAIWFGLRDQKLTMDVVSAPVTSGITVEYNDANVGEDNYGYTGTLKWTDQRYAVSCGNAFKSTSPLTAQLTSTTTPSQQTSGNFPRGTTVQVGGQTITATNTASAKLVGFYTVLNWFANDTDFATQLQGMQSRCSHQLSNTRWQTVLISPAGWAIVIAVLGLVVLTIASMFGGGDVWNIIIWK